MVVAWVGGVNFFGGWYRKSGKEVVTFEYRLMRVDTTNLTDMGKNRVVYVGFSSKSGFVSASTKAGLGRLIGVSSRTVMRNLGGAGKTGMVSKADEVWWICESEVSKLDRGRDGKGGPVRSKIGRVTPAIGFDAVERLDSGKLVSVKREVTKTKKV